jgi:hypothetical protein
MTDPEPWQSRTPDLVADVRLYPTESGGRRIPALLGWGCPCFASKGTGERGWDARLQLGDEPFAPGTERRVGFVFLWPEGAETMKRAGHFYLWEGRFIGEAQVVGD